MNKLDPTSGHPCLQAIPSNPIDLRGCKPGWRFRLVDGTLAELVNTRIGNGALRIYPHVLKQYSVRPSVETYTNQGHALQHLHTDADVMESLGLPQFQAPKLLELRPMDEELKGRWRPANAPEETPTFSLFHWPHFFRR